MAKITLFESLELRKEGRIDTSSTKLDAKT
jgi:hypothetical protein